MKTRVGILGGTFDPIHNAHLALGRQAMLHFGLEQVLFMPTGDSYFKSGKQQITDASHRAAMVRLAIADEPQFVFSDIELLRDGKTYTADTLSYLHRQNPEVEYHFILGADSLRDIDRWYEPQIIFDSAVILVANRNYQVSEARLRQEILYLKEKFHARIELLQVKSMDISSTQIRAQVEKGGGGQQLVPPAVFQYIQTHGLYREEASSKSAGKDRT